MNALPPISKRGSSTRWLTFGKVSRFYSFFCIRAYKMIIDSSRVALLGGGGSLRLGGASGVFEGVFVDLTNVTSTELSESSITSAEESSSELSMMRRLR